MRSHVLICNYLANMFIPLTINQRRDGLPNVLIAGDTAGIFYLLSLLTALEMNIFLADTGIRKPLRDFPCHRGESSDRANVYYDFFDGNIGAGIPRRMDIVLTTSCELKKWTRDFKTPAIHAWQDASGTWLEFEGYEPEMKSAGKDAISGLVSNFINASRGCYKSASSRVLVDRESTVHAFPSTEKWEARERLIPEESTFSAWDRASDILKKGESLVTENGDIGYDEDVRLIEFGVPELDVIAVKSKGETKYVELTGDLARVFDGLF